MKLAKGFCDLNISADDKNLKATVLKALYLGYQTVAINTNITDNSEKKKKGGGPSAPLVPPPPTLHLTPEELKVNNIRRDPVILTRVTVTYSQPGSPFLAKYKAELKQYDLVAFQPTNEAAFRQVVSQSAVDVDIISLAQAGHRIPRRVILQAVERDIYFELNYAPLVHGGSGRQSTIMLAHHMHQSSRMAHVIVTSCATDPFTLRGPYDVANLGRFLGMTEAGAKAAVSSVARDVVYCAGQRAMGAARCAAQVTVLRADGADNQHPSKKFKGLDDARGFMAEV